MSQEGKGEGGGGGGRISSETTHANLLVLRQAVVIIETQAASQRRQVFVASETRKTLKRTRPAESWTIRLSALNVDLPPGSNHGGRGGREEEEGERQNVAVSW